MTDKLERLSRIEAEAAALRKEIEAEQVKTPCFTPKDGETHWQLGPGRGQKHFVRFECNVYPPKVAFRDKATAEAYEEAFNVMLELRLYADGGEWYVGSYGDCSALPWSAMPWRSTTTHCSDSSAFGRYSSKAQAQKAIDAVGEDRIIQAIKTLCGVL